MKRVGLLLGISLLWLPLSMIADGLTTLILPNQLVTITDKATQATALGLITFVGILAGMLIQPIAGVFSDRLRPYWGRRGMIALGIVFTLVALFFFGLSQAVLAILVSYLLVQITTNVIQAAQQGFIPDLVPSPWRGTASGLKGLMDIGGAFLGFILLGILLEGGQIDLAIAMVAVVLLLAFAVTLLVIREPKVTASPSTTRLSLVDIFRFNLQEHRAFVCLVISRFLFLLGTYAVGRFLLYFVAHRLNVDTQQANETAGNVLAALTLVTALASLPMGWAADRLGRIPLMVAGSALSALGVLLLISAGTEAQILLFGGLMSVGSAAFASANWALTADLAPSTEVGRFLAIANFGAAGAAAAAGLLGPLVDWANTNAAGAGYTVLFVTAALAFVASAIALRGVTITESALAPARISKVQV
jgi:MFS family permease